MTNDEALPAMLAVRLGRMWAAGLLSGLFAAVLSAEIRAAGFDVSGTDPAALPVVPAGFTVTMPAR
ncbi:MAG: hypothetical protein ACKO6B_00865, partial [Planctomycetia bacterium]